ncbi:DUF3347 domain-containing protein [Flavobacterium sp.]|uniref:DUF3347 domain-containing protein n=1 Tax=Flavobacterium sp. TaxID=239 RepID=UPI0028BF38F3|nr:DUF3347 domain-containing protein [Flavobacterium sp.]
MNSLKYIMIAFVMLSVTACDAQIKNAKTESVKIYGNCGMCESTIEKAGNIKKVAQVDWDEETKMATLTYDASKTNPNEILKRIALSGYDSDQFLAPDAVYAKLPECCQYERVRKTTVKEEYSKHHQNQVMEQPTTQEENQFKTVFDTYFSLKDALVKTDGTQASTYAKSLLAALNVIEMGKLANQEHAVWMKVMKDLVFDAEHIQETKDVGHQRDHFMSLSGNMYTLMKASKHAQPVYYQFCPMANSGKGANWLSMESAVKNPYYGSQMLTCGKTVETLK